MSRKQDDLLKAFGNENIGFHSKASCGL